MAEQRLPAVNADDGAWGDILNQYLAKEHYKDSADYNQATSPNGGHKAITLRPGTTADNTAPIRFDYTSSSVLMTNKAAGAFEYSYTNDRFYLTQVTSTARKAIATYYDDGSGASGDIFYRDSNGNFIRKAIGDTGQIMTVNSSSIPTWSTVLDGTAKITVGTTEPSTPTAGDLWIDTN